MNATSITPIASGLEARSDRTGVPARWIRLPKSGAICEWTGFTRGQFYRHLKLAGEKIRTANVGSEGSRGVRIVFLPDLMAYVASLVEAKRSGTPQKPWWISGSDDTSTSIPSEDV